MYVAERYGVFYEDDTWKDIEHSGKDDEEEMWEHMEDYLSCPTDLQKLTHYYIEEIGGIDGEWKDSKSEIEAIRKKICEALWELAVYDTEPGATPAGKDFVEYFLFENRKGFCVHFASAGTLLFRLAGKEARYAEGYAVPASAFEEQEDGTYQAQISGAMGHAWCQVWCLDDGYWENVEVTPPAGIEQIQKSVEEMKLPKGRLARILYQNAGWLNTDRRTDACSFLFAGKKEMSCTEKKSRENDCRRIIWLRTAGGKDQRNQNGRTDRTEYFRDSERKVSGDYRRTMGKVVRAGVAGTFWKKRRAKSGAEKRTADLAEKILQPVF